MKNKILQLNNIYSNALSSADEVLKFLHARHIDCALCFCDQICSRINDELICRNYPMPVVICYLHNYKTQIGFDVATTAGYLGFIKFTLTKDEILRFNFDLLHDFEFRVYSTLDYLTFDFTNVKKGENIIKNSKSYEFRIKIDFSSLSQVEEIIGRMTKKNDRFFASASYTCICGSRITIDAQNGKCPVCGKESFFKRRYKRCKCPVCKSKCFKDQYGNGKCNECGWILDANLKQSKFKSNYPNLISLHKAKMHYKHGKPFEPDLDDFIEDLFFYSEMQFEYNGTYYAVELVGDSKEENNIQIYDSQTKEIQIFKSKTDFKNNAKVDGKLLKDIWDETTDRYWLQ